MIDTNKELDKVCREVAKEFPGLSCAAFFAEVQWRAGRLGRPRPDEFDVRAEAMRMVSYGELIYTIDFKVKLPEAK